MENVNNNDGAVKFWRESFADFRAKLRDILSQHGIHTNPGMNDDEILSCVDKLIQVNSIKAEAWDKVRQNIQEMGNFQVTDIMDDTLRIITAERTDDKKRRLGTVKPI